MLAMNTKDINIVLTYFVVFGIGGLMFLNFYQAKWRASELAACIKLALARVKLLAAQSDAVGNGPDSST